MVDIVSWRDIDSGSLQVIVDDDAKYGCWFRYLFTDDTVVGLARRLNPDAFYCAARWDYQDVPRDVLRRCFMKLSSTTAMQSIFARPVDWGPNERTKRVLDIRPGTAKALAVKTDDTIRGDLILPILP